MNIIKSTYLFEPYDLQMRWSFEEKRNLDKRYKALERQKEVHMMLGKEVPLHVSMFLDTFRSTVQEFRKEQMRYMYSPYVVAIGHEDGKIIFEDPASWKRVHLTEEELEERWHDTDEMNNTFDHLGIVVQGTPKFDVNRTVPMG